ncbi:hypothetical protein VNO77_20490 [Canavalia gladiata]|uniref:TIR domain-containing protein n=1 Tax=Canavalia gladiata TaxID=3824 RepID=A0AAN9LPC0_CANGL
MASSNCSSSKSKLGSNVFLFFESDDKISSFIDGLSFSLRDADVEVTEFCGCLGQEMTSVPSDPPAISVVVLTRKYLNCESCRQMLELILLWWEEGSIILPLFYDIDMEKEARHNRSGILKDVVLGMFHYVATEWHGWWNFSALNSRDERWMIEEIKDYIFLVFIPTMHYAADTVVGLKHVEDVIELLKRGSNCPLILEIWGEDGIDRLFVTQILNDSGVPAETIINILMKRKLVTVDEKNMLRVPDLMKEMGREIIVKKPKHKQTYDVFLSFRALTRAADCSGWDSRNYGTEIELIDHILETISKKVDDNTNLFISNHPVGVISRVQDDRHYVTEILNGCGLEAEIGISTLIERSLITVDNKNKLQMHNLIRDMGREIVREESPKHPDKRSRLWFHDDVVNVLLKHSGTEAIEGFGLKFPNINNVPFDTKAFEKMEGLRLIQLDHVELTGDYKYLPKNLKWLCWHGFPLGAIPDDFDQRSLVAIDLKYSKLVQVWKKPQLLERLQILNLSHSRRLTQTPDFSKLPNLERLLLKDCSSLSMVHPSIGGLSKLLFVNLKDCKNLSNLPRSIYKLKSLKTFIISGCSMIDKLEGDIEQMESLITLMAADTAISHVPFSLVRLKNIGYLSLCGYEGLPCDVFPHLIWSWMPPVSNLLSFTQASRSKPSFLSSDMDTSFHDILSCFSINSYLRSLKFQCQSKYHIQQDKRRVLDALCVTDCTELEARAGASQKLEMGTSKLRDKDNQIHVSGSQSSSGSLWIYMGEHNEAANSHKEIILQGQSTGVFDDRFLNGDKYSNLQTYKGEGSSVLFKMPKVIGHKFKGIAICVVYSSSLGDIAYKYLRNVLIINHTKATIQLHKREVLTSPKVKEWQFIMSDLGPGDEVEIVVDFKPEFTVDTTAANLVYGESIEQNL